MFVGGVKVFYDGGVGPNVERYWAEEKRVSGDLTQICGKLGESGLVFDSSSRCKKWKRCGRSTSTE